MTDNKRFTLAWLGVILMLGIAIIAGWLGLGLMIAIGIFLLGVGLTLTLLSSKFGQRDRMILVSGIGGIVIGVFLILWSVLPRVTNGTVSFPLLLGATIAILAIAGIIYVIAKK